MSRQETGSAPTPETQQGLLRRKTEAFWNRYKMFTKEHPLVAYPLPVSVGASVAFILAGQPLGVVPFVALEGFAIVTDRLEAKNVKKWEDRARKNK